jgi:tRNA uridine 5-carboxymethylaminomethyl modification enzyme
VLGGEQQIAQNLSAMEMLRRPEVSYAQLLELIGPAPGPASGAALEHANVDERLLPQIALDLEVRASYSGYIERQEEEIERQRRNETTALPADLDYARLAGLSNEVRQRLLEIRPATLGQAARVPGVTPAAVSILLVHLKKRSLVA